MKMKSLHSLIFIFCLSLAFAQALHGASATIHINGSAFVPPNQTINVGESVTWINDDALTHTSTSGQPGAPNGIWDSGFLTPGKSFTHTFSSAGTFPFYCQVHPFMTGAITVQGAQGGAPTVSITSPANNTTMATPGSVTIEANASTTSGSIAQVEFFDGTKSLGVDTSSPYSVTADLAAGPHSLTAKATDNQGASAVSDAVTVTVGGGGNEIADPIPQKIAKGNITIELQPFITGLVSPLGMAAPDDGSGRLFVHDQVGLIYVISNGFKMDTPLLDIKSRLVPLSPGYDERGLLGVALHPNFSQHPFIYTYTSEPNGPMADFMIMYDGGITNNHQSVITEWRIDAANSNRVDMASRREILRIDKPQSNHNGGTMRFGPDGFLYFTVGDGGQADDQGNGHSPGGNGQDKTKILGKVSRIDVDARTSANGQYGVPADNPFVGQSGALPEIFAYGLRNPYSFSFDRQTGDLLLGDVGQNDVEEVDHITKGGNYGWPIKEGSFYFDPNGTNNGFVTTMPVREVPADLIDPIGEYDHDEGDAVVGGYMYRGSQNAAIRGVYVTGDLGQSDENKFGRLFYLDGSEIKELRIGTDDRPLGFYLKGFGEDSNGELYVMGSTNLGPTGTAGMVLKITSSGSSALPNRFVQRNLVSDVAGLAENTDPQLVNPWGIALSSTSPFWLNDNGTGVSTLYNGAGVKQALVVTVPTSAGGTPPSSPTGMIFNGTTNFVVGGSPARFVFAGEDGVISAWASGSNATVMVDNSASSSIYKGLAQGSTGGANYLYAADFHNGKIDAFDGSFKPATLAGSFSDSGIPAGFAPFNIQNLGGQLYVSYAKQDADKEDDLPGAGSGYVDIFDTSGNLVKHLIAQGALNSPWGLALAPSGFGPFGGSLLVGNFGDGKINAFDPASGASLGQLTGTNGNSITIEGLWALQFGNGGNGGDPKILYFTAGISGGSAIEDHGLFGSLSFSGFAISQVTHSGNNLTISWTGGTGPYVLQKKTNLFDPAWTDVQTLSETTVTVPIDGTAGFFRVQQKTQ